MMMRALAVLAVLWMVPGAMAHVESFSETKSLVVGPYNVILEPTSNPLYANMGVQFGITAYAQDGRPAKVSPEFWVILPDGTRKDTKPTSLTQGYSTASLALTQRGNHTAVVRVTDGNGTHEGNSTFEVYPDLPIRIVPLDADQDITVNETTRLTFVTIHSVTLKPVQLFDDLAVRIQRWTDDHERIVGETETELTSLSNGSWATDATMNATGMYHLAFASETGNFSYGDVPLLHTYAAPDFGGATSDAPARAPGVAAPALLLALAGTALMARRWR